MGKYSYEVHIKIVTEIKNVDSIRGIARKYEIEKLWFTGGTDVIIKEGLKSLPGKTLLSSLAAWKRTVKSIMNW